MTMFGRPVLPGGLCSNRTSGRRDVAGEVPDSLDKGSSAVHAARHERDVCRDELSNVVVLDLA